MSDPFWFDDVSVVYKFPLEFFPTSEQTQVEKLNSILRLALYISILIILQTHQVRYIFIVVGIALLTYYIYTNLPIKEEPQQQVQDKVEKFEGAPACTKPTLDNPFMNVTMKDYLNIQNGQTVDRLPACDPNEPTIKKEIDSAFNNDLFHDVNDVFGKMNSQRQFYTMPWTTIPNKQDEFARWLYLQPKTCKEDQDACLRYEDIRQKTPVYYNPNENPVDTKKQVKN